MIKLGICLIRLVDSHNETRIDNRGTIIFGDIAVIGKGSKLLVLKNGVLTISDSFNATASLNIVCENQITIGNDCMLSWNITLIDTDYHPITTSDGYVTNAPKPVVIGKHVWIGFNATILKGVNIPDNSIIASGCLVKRSLERSNTIYSYPSNLLGCVRENIKWTKDVF